MKTRTIYLLVVVLTFSSYYSINGRTPFQQRQDENPIRLRATEVSLDIVVRDKKGRPVRDLKAPDFEVYEDGIRQNIESFRFVMREAAAGANTSKREEPAPQAATPL